MCISEQKEPGSDRERNSIIAGLDSNFPPSCLHCLLQIFCPPQIVYLQSTFTLNPSTMSRIEELPDDFDESLNLNEVPPEVTQDLPQPGFDAFAPSNEAPFPINEEKLKELENDPYAPKLPPTIASVKSHSKEELLSMMNKTPLFMTDIENAGDESMLFSLCIVLV